MEALDPTRAEILTSHVAFRGGSGSVVHVGCLQTERLVIQSSVPHEFSD